VFNLFKNKLNYLVPSDISKGLVSSNFVTIKIGDKITIFDDIVCFVTYKDRFFYEFTAGTYILSKETLLDLYDRQRKGQKNLKKLKIDFFFVNTRAFDFPLSYADKVIYHDRLTKLLFEANINLSVTDAKKFCTAICHEVYSTTALHSNDLVLSYIENDIRTYFLRKRLDSLDLGNNIICDIRDKISKSLTKIGISLNQFSLRIAEKSDGNVQRKKFFSSSHKNTNLTQEIENKFDQTQKTEYTNHQETLCPQCKSKLIKGSLYCHRCGYRR